MAPYSLDASDIYVCLLWAEDDAIDNGESSQHQPDWEDGEEEQEGIQTNEETQQHQLQQHRQRKRNIPHNPTVRHEEDGWNVLE